MPTADDMRAAYDALRAWGEARRANVNGRLTGWEYVQAMRDIDALADHLALAAATGRGTVTLPAVPIDAADERVVDALVSQVTSRSVARRLAAQRSEPRPMAPEPYHPPTCACPDCAGGRR